MSEIANPDSSTQYAPPSDTVETRYLPPPPAAKKKRGWLWLLLLILLLIAGSSSYFAYQLWTQLQSNQNQQQVQTQQNHATTKTLQQEIAELKQHLQALQPQQQEWQQKIHRLQVEQQQLQQAYAQLYNKLRRTGDNEDWSIAEVGYLLRIAQQRLSLGNDLSAALQALQAADQRLHSAGALFLPVREQLAKDIQYLQSLETPDIEGMALRLAGYAQSCGALPLLQGNFTAKPLQHAEDTTAESAKLQFYHWYDIASTVWGEMRKLVVIRYNDSADAGLLSPTERSFLTDNLRIKFNTARLLLLNRDTEQFRLEINTVLSWLKRYYDLQNKAVAVLHSDLEQMQKIALKPELPDTSKALAVLEQLNRAATGGDEALPLLNSDATQVTP